MQGDNIELDPEAQRLFEQFAGMESWQGDSAAGQGADRLAESLFNEQKRLDTVRILLIRMAHLISLYLKDDRFAGHSDAESAAFQGLSEVLTDLGRLAGYLGCAFIRFRGAPAEADLPEKFDYEIVIGNTAVDSSIAPRVARRNGEAMAHLPKQIREAFTIFADYGVNNIYLEIPEKMDGHMPAVQLCLKILSGFRIARRSGAPIGLALGTSAQSVPVVNDENLFPDPNLTLLGGLNRLNLKTMESLVDKVDQWSRRKGKASSLGKYAGVYNAALDLPKIRVQLKKPPVELNNVKWLLTETKDEAVSLEKVFIAQLAMDIVGSSPQKVAKMIKSIYGDDYAKINQTLLSERLNLSSDLLAAAEKRDPDQTSVKKEVLGNLHQRLDQVKDHVIDDVQVSQQAGDGQAAGQASGPVVHDRVFNMVQFFKGRSVARKKMVGMVHRPIEFKPRDFEILAKDFRISVAEAQELVAKLKSCFGEGGRFKKSGFQAAIAHFRQYEQKIFGFLWHHLKDAILPEDRVAFLNALQQLTAQMNQPNRAFKILLEDICGDPENVQFSDNKAIMLANLMIHRPDKSLADYEITPEDIVLNQHHLDPMVVQYAAWRIDKESEQFFTKVKTIHTNLSQALCLGETAEKRIPASVLLNLERELYIFLSMVPCDTGKAILRSAVNEYGDPGSEIYHLKESDKFMGGLLQNLRVALRGVGSVGASQDLARLEAVKTHNEDFQRLKNDRQFRTQARLVNDWADEAIKIIKFRS
jgi:hypothetical protein